MIRIGTIIYGYCGGIFGRDVYEDKRVEAMGADWVVCRTIPDGLPVFARVDKFDDLEYDSK